MLFEQLNPHACRTYLIAPDGSDHVVLVDPVLDHVNDYMELLERRKFDLTHVVDTHTHADHISGSAALRDHTDCEYLMYAEAPAGCVTSRLHEGQEWRIGDLPVTALFTPGHTSDALSLVLPDRILTGDALFLDDAGAGRDDLPGGDPGAHWETLQRFLQLPDHLVVYPAHDYRGRQPSSLGRQKDTNPHLKPRTKEQFIQYLEDLSLGPADWMKDVLKANYACARDPQAAWIPTDLPACEVKGTLEHGVNDLHVDGITAAELNTMMAGGEVPLLLDVRESDELTGPLGHLPRIRHIPIVSLAHRLDELAPAKSRPIITVCRSGSRAHTAAQIMKQAGYENVRVLTGGMIAWQEAGFPADTSPS